MEYLATLYASLAGSDEVRARLITSGRSLPEGDRYEVAARRTPDGQRTLPLIDVAAISPSAKRAVSLANRVTAGLQSYVATLQSANKIPEDTRIVLPVVEVAEEATVFSGRKLTTAIMIGLLGTIATLFVAFMVDNVRRQRQLAEAMGDAEPALETETSVHHLGAPPKSSAGSEAPPSQPQRWSGESAR
jgi:hypothetical protein